jgi:hypothetical protein
LTYQENGIAHETQFADFLPGLWANGFHHSYNMPSPTGSAAHWARWRESKGYSGKRASLSLKDADQYAWDDIARAQDDPTSEECRKLLLVTLDRESEEELGRACFLIFKWGGVGGASNGKVIPNSPAQIDLPPPRHAWQFSS